MFKFICCLARFLPKPTSAQQDKQTTGGSTPGILVPRSSITGETETERKGGARNSIWPLHKAAPTNRGSPSPQEAAPVPSHPSTLFREGHSARVSLSPGFPKLLYDPPDLQYPSCYLDETGEEGKMGFPLPTIVTGSRSQRVIPRPAVSVALGKLLAKQIFRSHPRLIESESRHGPTRQGLLTSPPGSSNEH